jgi:hypothetical protein
MYKPVLLAMAAATTVAGLLIASSYGAEGGRRAEKAPTGKGEVYCVVQVGDEVSVIRKSELKNLQKSTKDEDKQRKKDYDQAKKEAKTAKEKADLGKPPVPRTPKLLKGSFKSEDEAKDWMDKHVLGKEGDAKGAKDKKVY